MGAWELRVTLIGRGLCEKRTEPDGGEIGGQGLDKGICLEKGRLWV